MVGILIALSRTKLYERLKKEQRLLKPTSGNNTDFATNFIPRMGYDPLINGYQKVLKTIYSPKYFYERVRTFLRVYNPPKKKTNAFWLRLNYLAAFFRSVFVLGVMGKERFHYWKLLFWTMFTRPRLLPQAITFAIYGYHFRKTFENRVG